MYRFICINGHVTRSAARETTDPNCHCGEGAYRIADAPELAREGVNAYDCVREVESNGETYCLHLRTGLAYTRAEVRKAASS